MSINAKEWNSCAELMNDEASLEAAQTYNNLLKEGKDPFQHMLQMQFDLQMALANKSPKHNPKPSELDTLGQKFDWLRENKQAFDDEYSEMIDALPGMSMTDKDRSAVWKRWKSKYDEVRGMTFDDLTPEDLRELKFELVDSWHFYMNMLFALDMTAEEMFIYYVAKNQENHRRAQSGY